VERLPLDTNPEEGNDDVFLKHLSDILAHAFEKAKDRLKLYETTSNFARDLERKYPDAHSRRLWHLLIGSSPMPGMEMNMEDYPGEDSIVQFIEGLDSSGV